MSKESFEANIFIVICDISIKQLNKTKFSNYISACNYIKEVVDCGKSELADRYITDIYAVANEIYGFSLPTMIDYIHRYFAESQFSNYYELMKEVRECFGDYVKIDE